MATIDSLSEEYATYLILNRNDPNVVSELAKRINKLTYTESGKYLSNEDKEKILNKLKLKISPNNDLELPDGTFLIQESQDSSDLIKLIQLVRLEVKK